jgi:heterodisulfide reductase subunit A-like polyferredoxin
MKNLFKRKKLRHDYVKGKPFFCQFEKIKAYPYLNKTVHTDVLIIGGGIIGAITNFYLSQHFDVVLVDKSRFGMCCTSCATVLLEYQLDDFADDLLSIMSEEEIVEVYKMGLFSIDKIQEFIDTYGNHCHFNKRPSLLYTNNIFGKKAIEKEFEFRVKHGFKAQLFNKENNPFSFDFVSGLYCEDGGAEITPYLSQSR